MEVMAIFEEMGFRTMGKFECMLVERGFIASNGLFSDCASAKGAFKVVSSASAMSIGKYVYYSVRSKVYESKCCGEVGRFRCDQNSLHKSTAQKSQICTVVVGACIFSMPCGSSFERGFRVR